MNTTQVLGAGSLWGAVARLFAEKLPVLVEVRFPKMGTSPDWYLVREEYEFAPIWEALGPGSEVRLSSVFDLKDATGAVVLSR